MGIGIIPRVNERSALVVGVATPFFLLGGFRFGKRGVFAYSFCCRIVDSDFLPFTTGRTLTFHWCHGQMFDWSRWVEVFEEEDAVKKKRNEKAFCVSDVKRISLNTGDINDDMKG